MTRTAIRTLILSLALASVAGATPTPEQKCFVAKSKASGKYYGCLHKASAKYQTTNDFLKFGTDQASCEVKFLRAWNLAELVAAAANASCYDGSGDVQAFDDGIRDHWDAVRYGLYYYHQPIVCGNGTAETITEQCDGSDLNGKTCQTQGFLGGTLRCASGCTLDTSGCYATRWVPLPNAMNPTTVRDNETGLEWEVKTTAVGSGQNYADPHDVDNEYSWGTTTAPYPPNGTAFTDFIARLNGSADAVCFTGKCDWRLPTVGELQGIVDGAAPGCGSGSPCINGTFGPTVPDVYWSSSTYADVPQFAWYVDFYGASDNTANKTFIRYVRAVRGGS